MAAVNDIDPGYRDIARQVPPKIRREMGPVELQLRAEYVDELLSAKRTVQAARACQAVPFAVLFRALDSVSKLIVVAREAGEEDTALGLARELHKIAEDNPSNITSLIADGDERAIEVLTNMINEPPRKRWWKFWRSN
jgi:hypothetical protein